MGKFITQEQWGELSYLDKIMPRFYLDIQESNLLLTEYMYNDHINSLEESNKEPLSYHEFWYYVKTCHEHADSAHSIMICLQDEFISRDIAFDNNTGEFFRSMSIIERSTSPKKVLRDYLLQKLSFLLKDPIDDFDQKLIDPTGKIEKIIHKYFD